MWLSSVKVLGVEFDQAEDEEVSVSHTFHLSPEDFNFGVERLGRCVCGSAPEIVQDCRRMVLESLDHRPEIGVAELTHFLVPFIHQPHGFDRCCLGVEYIAEAHGQVVGVLEDWIMPEQYVHAMTLYISPFVG